MESSLLEMVVKTQRSPDTKPIHHDEGHAIGERVSLILVPLQKAPPQIKQLLVDVNHLNCTALKQTVADFHSLFVVRSGIEERYDLAKYVRGSNQSRQSMASEIMPVIGDSRMAMVIRQLQRKYDTLSVWRQLQL